MSESMWKRLKNGWSLEVCHTRLMAASGNDLAVMGRIPPMLFTIERTEIVLSFVVVSDIPNRDVLLGRDFLVTYDVEIDLVQGRAKIKKT